LSRAALMDRRRSAKEGGKLSGAIESGSSPEAAKAALRPRSRNSSRPKRRGSTKRNSRPLSRPRRAWVWAATGELRAWSPGGGRSCRDGQSTGRQVGGGCGRRPKFADDVFSGAMHRNEHAAFKTLCLAGARCFEGLAVAPEPRLNDAVAAHTLVDAASYGFHFGQFGHSSIVGGRVEFARGF
jgi:hypothetical protein